MFWIEGIGRDKEGFVLETIVPDEGRQAHTLQQWPEPLKFGRATRTRITTDCATWTRECGQAYWQALGIEAQHPRDGQGIFRFSDDGKQYLVPASVFITAMMSPIQRIQAQLFKPQGLESFCTPLLDCETPRVGLHFSPATLFGCRASISTGLLARYSWMHCFPSAHAMYSSVYQAACNGRLDVELPKARITMTLRSIKVGGVQLVTEMLILKLEALEAPYEFAANHARHIVLHESAELDWQKLHRPESTISPRGQEWHLSDAEWQAIEPMFDGRSEKKHSLRDIINLILFKLGTRQAWRKLDFGELNFPIVQATYQRMTKLGQWQTLAATLNTLRSQAPRAA